jgi:transcriptional regulator with XRE-family HTH domain
MTLGRLGTNLRGRREALGATQREMASGLGISTHQLSVLEESSAQDERWSFYSAWLSRLEAAAQGRRREQFKRASRGLRFD